jgi:hypothetical protein
MKGSTSKDLGFYTTTHTDMITDMYRFTNWQATGENDARSSAYSGLRQVSPVAPIPAASLATRRPV